VHRQVSEPLLELELRAPLVRQLPAAAGGCAGAASSL